jgi:hypothetical protein
LPVRNSCPKNWQQLTKIHEKGAIHEHAVFLHIKHASGGHRFDCDSCNQKHPEAVEMPPAVAEVAQPLVREVTDYEVFTAREVTGKQQ